MKYPFALGGIAISSEENIQKEIKTFVVLCVMHSSLTYGQCCGICWTCSSC